MPRVMFSRLEFLKETLACARVCMCVWGLTRVYIGCTRGGIVRAREEIDRSDDNEGGRLGEAGIWLAMCRDGSQF